MPEGKSPDKNCIHFNCLNNYAGVLLKMPTKRLLIDPTDVKAKKFSALDAILITHEHYDHFDQRLLLDIQAATNCTIIADQTSAQKLKMLLPPKKLVSASVGDKFRIGEVIIKTYKCNHTSAATPVTYLITSEDGVNVWHTADSSPYPEMAQIGKETEIDVIFCSVGIAQGVSAESGSEIAWLTKPKVAVPYHTSTVESQKQFAQILKKELPKTTCLIPEVGKTYRVCKEEKKT
jgi:L-ascorbate metabolism protein UlaG (beta-lactamase superfamily)